MLLEKRIAILIVDTDEDERLEENLAEHIFGAVMTDQIISRHCSFAAYFLAKGHFPQTDERIDAAIITGGYPSVYQELPWMAVLYPFIQTHDIPMLGICLGHQVIAKAHGGIVEAIQAYAINDPKFEFGYQRMDVTAAGIHDPLFHGLTTEEKPFFYANCSHKDTIVQRPRDAVVLAENQFGIQSFHINHHYGVQFHPEVDLPLARRALRRRRDDPHKPIGPNYIRDLVLTLQTLDQQYTLTNNNSTSRIIRNFIHYSVLGVNPNDNELIQ